MTNENKDILETVTKEPTLEDIQNKQVSLLREYLRENSGGPTVGVTLPVLLKEFPWITHNPITEAHAKLEMRSIGDFEATFIELSRRQGLVFYMGDSNNFLLVSKSFRTPTENILKRLVGCPLLSTWEDCINSFLLLFNILESKHNKLKKWLLRLEETPDENIDRSIQGIQTHLAKVYEMSNALVDIDFANIDGIRDTICIDLNNLNNVELDPSSDSNTGKEYYRISVAMQPTGDKSNFKLPSGRSLLEIFDIIYHQGVGQQMDKEGIFNVRVRPTNDTVISWKINNVLKCLELSLPECLWVLDLRGISSSF